MRSVAPFFCLPLLLLACGAGGGVGPAQAPQGGLAPSEPGMSTATTSTTKATGLGAAPAGLVAPAEDCKSYVGGPPAACPGGAFDEQLAGALALSGLERDSRLRCLESAKEAPAGLVRALRADSAPRGCADLVVGEDAAAPGAAREISETMIALGIAARLQRAVRQPPLPRPPFNKQQFIKHFKEVLTPWIREQAHAVDVMSQVGPRLTGYARGVVALEAGLADMRFVDVARSIELPEEMKNDAEIRETYLVSLEQGLEPRVVRGRDAALVGFGELAKQGITNDVRLEEARALLSELYAGRRIDSLDRLLLPPAPPLTTDTPALKLAALLPAFYALKLSSSPNVDDPKLLRARLEQGVPPALWLSTTPPRSPELAVLAQRALFRLGQTYFWAEPFAKAAAIEVPSQDASAMLLSALAKLLAQGPRNAAALMLGPPTLPAALRETQELDALARARGPLAGLAEFDAAYVRSLAPPANDPVFWKEQAARFERAQKKLPVNDKAAKSAAADLAKAARDTEKELSQKPKL
jgi:hypothetical protein